MKHTLKYLAVVAAFGLCARAQADVGKTQAYAEGVTASTVWKSNFGECWRTGTWSKDQAVIEGCDGYVKPVATPAVVAKPAPAPIPAAAPAPVATKFTLKADVLFDLNKSTLKPAGKAELDKLSADLKNIATKDKTIKVVGHADRLGSAAYNQKLSESRAKTVASYLSAKGVNGAKVVTEGKGKTAPVTGKKCDKVKPKSKLVACLAPDRRVEIEVSGTK